MFILNWLNKKNEHFLEICFWFTGKIHVPNVIKIPIVATLLYILLSLIIAFFEIFISYRYMMVVNSVLFLLFFFWIVWSAIFQTDLLSLIKTRLSYLNYWFYIALYTIFVILSLLGLSSTSQGWSGLIYFFTVPGFLFLILYNVIVGAILRFKFHKERYFIRLDWLLLIAVQIALMIWNFKDGGDGPRTAEMQKSSEIASFLFPVYILLSIYFGLFNIFVRNQFANPLQNRKGLTTIIKPVLIILFVAAVIFSLILLAPIYNSN